MPLTVPPAPLEIWIPFCAIRAVLPAPVTDPPTTLTVRPVPVSVMPFFWKSDTSTLVSAML